MVAEPVARQGADVTRRVLVVDDSHHFRSTAAELLSMRGLGLVAAAADGEEAYAAVVAHGCPDGVLLDVNLPGPDGFTVAASLSSVCPSARIVLTSADVVDVPMSALTDCGAVAFVPKTELATVDLDQLFTPDRGRARGRTPPGLSSADM
jgi:CheY-like chemotaxis protein